MNSTGAKTELLAELEREWANIERICAGMSEAELVAPHAQDQWSVKDILVHIAAWEKYLLDRMGYVMTGQKPKYPIMNTWEDVHRFNAQVYDENKDRPLTSAILEFRSLYRGVMTVIEAMSEDQLNQPYTYDFADDNITVLQLIKANTFEHYREHCRTISIPHE